MMHVRSSTAVAVLAAAFAFLAAGCDPTSCALTPPINDWPASCSLPAETTVEVNIRWCNCGATVECDVTRDGPSFLLEPRVTSCDAECPGNPDSCDIDGLVSCVFTTPGPGTYGVTIGDGLGVQSSTFHVVASGGDDSCGP